MNTTPLLDLLFHTALKGAAVLLVALLLGLILRRMAAARRYALWITTIATLALLPLAMGLLPAWHVLPKASGEMNLPVMETPQFSINAEPALPAEGSAATTPDAGPALPLQAPAPPAISWNISWHDVVEALPTAWMLVAGLLLLRLALSAWRLRRLESSLHPGACPLLKQAGRELGLRRSPRLLIGPADSVPMVWGVFGPRLLLPLGFESWPHEKQRGVLLHELAHLKRGDPLALWLAQWVKALHWFNPLVWLTLRQLRADQERACDDAVLRHGVRASDYAQSLLDLSRHNRLAPGLSLCALTITRCAPVEARVKAILDPSRRRESLTLRWLAGIAGCALLFALPVAMLHAIEGPTLRGRILDRNGVVLAESTKEKVRVYPLKTLAAHMVGYVRKSDLDGSVFEGHAAMEKLQNDPLKAGRDVTLTLDARIQALTMHAMKDSGVTRGAAVVLDPRTGEILASVSLPGFDPNAFIPSVGLEDWVRYLHDKNVPLKDRAQTGFYQPDAALTPLTGLAAIYAGVGDQSSACQAPVKKSQAVYSCWRLREGKPGHGMLSLDTAMEQGCWHYWYHIGMAAGFQKLSEVGARLGFGGSYGLVEETQEGVWPTEEWWEGHRRGQEAWPESNTADLAMGQGYVKTTPMQMAVLAATLANSGLAPQPRFIRGGGVAKLADFRFEGARAAQMQKLREGMRLVVNGTAGTGLSARSANVMIAGKNAMIQNWHRINQNPENTHSWFIGFAPFDQPTLAFAILKQGSKSAEDDATPIAKRIVEETLALPADGSGEVLPVKEGVSELQLAQAKFDAKADVLKASIERLKPEETTGFPLDEIRVRNGQILIRGVATGMIQALQFRDKVLALKWEDPLEWTMPVPQILADGKRVGLMMLATLIWEGKTTTSLEKVQASLKSLNDPRAYGWEELRNAAGLAELPGGTEAWRVAMGDPSVNFYLQRKNIAGWLRASLGAEVDVGWLETNTSKVQHYPAKNGYHIEVQPLTPPNLFKVTVKASVKTTAVMSGQVDSNATETAIRMKSALAKQWSTLKRVGLLADLPSRARPFDLGDKHPERQVKSVPTFHFWASREEVRRWLLESHCQPMKGDFLSTRQEGLASALSQPVVEDIAADWPAPPQSFRRTYMAAGHCQIDIHVSDGEHVTVTVSRRTPSILIAPEESREPRPAGRLAPEYDGKSVTQSESGMPTLDVAVQALRPEISPQEVPLPTFRPQPIQIRFQPPKPSSAPRVHLPAPLDRLKGELSEESQKALERSYLKAQARSFLQSSRMQQALVVQLPQK